MEVKRMKAIVLTCLAVLTGCATHGNTVRCDRRLEPINTPTPHALQTLGSASSALDEAEAGRE